MNCMIDIETLSTAPNAVVLSVGLVFFTKNGILEKIYFVPEREPQIAKGRHVDLETLSWWMRQDNAARQVFGHSQEKFAALHNRIDAALKTMKTPWRDVLVWGNGANFDEVILGTFWEDMSGQKRPWHYSNVRCYRTFNAMTGCSKLMTDDDAATHHNALDDAIWQATAMIRHASK